MKRIIHGIERNITKISKVSLFVISALLIVYMFPRQVSFRYEFTQGRPWLDDDLIASFDFAIRKSTEEIYNEQQKVLEDFKPFFSYEEHKYDSIIDVSKNVFKERWEDKYGKGRYISQKRNNIQTLETILDTLFNTGIIFTDSEFEQKYRDESIRVLYGHVAETRKISDFFTIRQAQDFYLDKLDGKRRVDKELLTDVLGESLVHNVLYDFNFTQRARQAELESISPTRGMVQQGEKIISKGELVTAEKYRILDSYRTEFNEQIGEQTGVFLLVLGQIILVSIPILVLSLFLKAFRKDVFADNRRIILILLTVIMMVFFTSLVIKYDINYLYIVPVCIVPIMMRAFFDNRLALHVHIITVILIGFLVPRSFEFVLMQFIAGIFVILGLISLRKRSQLFIIVGWIILSYSAVYFGLSLLQGTAPGDLDIMVFASFGLSGVLTLFVYPLIFSFERIFGLPTDFSLLELSDINSKLLRELSIKAPGTFQHSLQVANLSEEAVFAIGGNPLLVRTGALYHDIGKMDAPLYFVENQHSEYNPHDEHSNIESAEIIIGHVMKGIEKARKYNLPEYIIDFIRTHHGSTIVKYFYSMEVNHNPDVEIPKQDFSYPGPRPFSKETAVLMMADAVEAASRSIKNPDEESIDEMVEKIINGQVQEKQFENANVTFRDIMRIKELFKKRLMNIFHVRISYPSLK